tara:strand:- start:2580 stop:2879 length:300 start_codon:yes stop_codon:yes gene_type:complete
MKIPILITVVALLTAGLGAFIGWMLAKYGRPSKTNLKEQCTHINHQLFDMGLKEDQIITFWQDTIAEAEIRHHLPKCTNCDVNQCDVWCRSKARFSMDS